jgi:CRISPR-associated endoribonuclease Cas6
MLLSAVIHLKALERGSLPQYMGAAVRSEFLSMMGGSESDEPESEAPLSEEPDEMHDGNQLRPYTVSDLKGTFRAQKGFNLVESGQAAWFRATTLKKEQSDSLRSLAEKIKGRVIKLGRVRFQVQNVSEAGKHPWARESSYQALVDRYFHSVPSPSDALEIQFASVTTFHAGDLHMPLPIPETVLGSWLRRWNLFSSASLPRVVDELKEAQLALSRYKIETSTVHYERAKWIGFRGNCRFRVLSGDEFWVRLCNLLADYSFYCGTGYKTTYGLGQTRRLDEMDRENP